MRTRRLDVVLLLLCTLGVVPAAAVEDLYVVSNGTEVFPLSASGDVAPLRVVDGPQAAQADFIAVDTTHGELITAGGRFATAPSHSIRVFDLTTTGTVVPLRTIAGPNTGIDATNAIGHTIYPRALALDVVHDEIAVGTNDTTVAVFGRTANGDVAPLRTLSGSNTTLSHPSYILVDTKNDELLVLNNGSRLTVFPRTASGNVSPSRTLTGSGFGSVFNTPAMALDTLHNELFFAISVAEDVGGFFGAVAVYSRTASGTTAPLRVLSGPATGFGFPEGVIVDRSHDKLFVSVHVPNCRQWDCVKTSKGSDAAIEVFDRTASGDTAPVRTIAGPATGLWYPGQLGIRKTFIYTPWRPERKIPEEWLYDPYWWLKWNPAAGVVLGNVFYAPSKLAFATLGAVVSGVTYVGTLGMGSAAPFIWNVTTGGDYVITPGMVATGDAPRFTGEPDGPTGR